MLSVDTANFRRITIKEIMMKVFTLKKMAAALTFASISAGASAALIDRVILPNGNIPFNAGISVVEQTISPDFSSISGYGVISTINGVDEDIFCPGCQLTFQYNGITLNANQQYQGGTVNVYVGDRTVSISDIGNPKKFTIANTITNNLFLSLNVASPFDGFTGGGGGLASLLQLNVNESGAVGAANSYFNTNGRPSGADLSLNISSTIQPQDGPGTFSIGSGNLFGGLAPVAPVPEPATMALIGLGLFGMGAARRKRLPTA